MANTKPSFAPGFTPVFTLTIPEGSEDLLTVENITVDMTSAAYHIVKDGFDVYALSETELEVELTQEESLRMRGTKMELQVNWTYPGTSKRWGTDTALVGIDRQLHMEVIGGE